MLTLSPHLVVPCFECLGKIKTIIQFTGGI